MIDCPACDGDGFGAFGVVSNCPRCGGSGKAPMDHVERLIAQWRHGAIVAGQFSIEGEDGTDQQLAAGQAMALCECADELEALLVERPQPLMCMKCGHSHEGECDWPTWPTGEPSQAARPQPQDTPTNVTRFEVIDDALGRVCVYKPCTIELSYQDDGRTLKAFVTTILPLRSPRP